MKEDIEQNNDIIGYQNQAKLNVQTENLDDIKKTTIKTSLIEESEVKIVDKEIIDEKTQINELKDIKNELGEEEGEKVEEEDDIRQAGIFSSIFNLSNAAIGAGVLGFPYALMSSGIITGVLMTIFEVTLGVFTLYVLADCSSRAKPNTRTYQATIFYHLGKFWGFLSLIVLALYLCGANIIYLTVIGDSLEPIMLLFFGDNPTTKIFASKKIIILIFSILFVLPLSLIKRIQALGFTSFLAVVGCVYMVVFIVFKTTIVSFIEGKFGDNLNILFNPSFNRGIMPQIFMSVPIISFAFQCHVLVVPVYAELKKPSNFKMLFIIISSIAICLILYLTCGVLGYLNFGDKTDADILKNYDRNDVGAIIGRAALTFTATFSYPISFYNARTTIQSLLFSKWKMNDTIFYSISIPYYIFTLLVALFVPGIQVLFGITGAVGAVSLMFFFPALLMVKVYNKNIILRIFLILLAILFVILCIIIASSGTAVSIYKMITGEG